MDSCNISSVGVGRAFLVLARPCPKIQWERIEFGSAPALIRMVGWVISENELDEYDEKSLLT
jgi:hypothetical protein